MKKLILIPIFLCSLCLITACFDNEKTAENTEKKQTESVEESISKNLYDQIMEIGGDELPSGDETRWENTKNIILEIEKLSEQSELKNQKRAITKVFKEYGFLSYPEGYNRIEQSSEMINYILNIELKMASLETIELTKGKKEVQKTKTEIISSLKSKGYTQADIKALDKYENIIGKSVSLLVKLPIPKKK